MVAVGVYMLVRAKSLGQKARQLELRIFSDKSEEGRFAGPWLIRALAISMLVALAVVNVIDFAANR